MRRRARMACLTPSASPPHLRMVTAPPVARLAGLFSETGHTRLRSMVRPLRRRLKKANSERTTRPALPPGLREELEFFREDVTELGGLLGCDLSHWLDRL